MTRSVKERSRLSPGRSAVRRREHGLEVASPRGREIGLVEFRAASPGDVSKDALATEPMEVAVVVLGLRTAWPGSDDVDPIPAFGTRDFRHRRRLCNWRRMDKQTRPENDARRHASRRHQFGDPQTVTPMRVSPKLGRFTDRY